MPTTIVAATTAIRRPGMRLKRLSGRITASVPAPTQCVQFARRPGPRRSAKVAQWPDALDREPEQLGQLADQHRERDAVHVAVADRLGEQFCDESQSSRTSDDAHQTRHHCHHAGQRYRPRGIARRRGRTTARISAAREESGPSTRMRLGPNSAYASSGTIVAYRP